MALALALALTLTLTLTLALTLALTLTQVRHHFSDLAAKWSAPDGADINGADINGVNGGGDGGAGGSLASMLSALADGDVWPLAHVLLPVATFWIFSIGYVTVALFACLPPPHGPGSRHAVGSGIPEIKASLSSSTLAHTLTHTLSLTLTLHPSPFTLHPSPFALTLTLTDH